MGRPIVTLGFAKTAAVCAAAVLIFLSLPLLAFAAPPQMTTSAFISRWAVTEITLSASRPFDGYQTAPPVSAVFRGGAKNQTLTVPGFWDGGATFRVRFAPPETGAWTWETTSPDAGLNHQAGKLMVTPAPPNQHGFVRRDPQNPAHFARDDRSPFFLFGTTYYNILNRTPDEWKKSVDGSARFGINKFRIHIPAGKGYVVEEPTLNRFRNGDAFAAYVSERNLVVDFIVFGSGYFHQTEAEDAAYLRYVVARYGAYSGVAWTLVNEWNYRPKPRDYWNRMGALLYKTDAWATNADTHAPRMMSIHQQTRVDFQFFDQPWVSHAIVQLGVRNGQKVSGENEMTYKGPQTGKRIPFGDKWGAESILANANHQMPVVNDEYGYIGEPEDKSELVGPDGKSVRLTREKHRSIIWGVYCAGGYASTGDKYDYSDHGGEQNRPYKTGYWEQPVEYEDIKHLVNFWTTKVPFRALRPAPNAVASGERVYVMAEAGKCYVAYVAHGGNFSLVLAPGTYSARRFDPRTGENIALPDVNAAAGAPVAFSLPDTRDWVVYLSAKAQP